MFEHYYAQPGPIKPVGLPGHRVAVWISPNWNAFRIAFMEQLLRSAPLRVNGGAAAAGATLAPLRLAIFELSETPPEMAQFRHKPLDDIEYDVRRGQSDFRFKVKETVSRGSLFSALEDPCGHSGEFMVLKGEEPYLGITNVTRYNLAQTRVAFWGFRFILEDLKVTCPTVEEMEKQMGGPVTFISAGGM